jgi:hypothetical protein
VTGFEPAASWSQTRRSSQTELHPVTSPSLYLFSPKTQALIQRFYASGWNLCIRPLLIRKMAIVKLPKYAKIRAKRTFIERKTSKLDQETWICFWICISVPLSVLSSLLFVPLGLLSPILFIAAVSHGMILLVKIFISKRDVKEKINNSLLILAGLLTGPLLLIGLFFYIVTHMNMKFG